MTKQIEMAADYGQERLSKKVKTALDETRLLILGAQILFGFKLQGVFQERFASLSFTARLLECLGQLLMAIAGGLPCQTHIDATRLKRTAG